MGVVASDEFSPVTNDLVARNRASSASPRHGLPAAPALKVAEWRTPTLVIQGDKDYRLVTSEAISTFTALQRQGVASELLFFPDENHHCLNPQNSLVWHDAVLAWCRRWT